MGVDPGLVDTGFGVLEADGHGFTVIDAGVVSTVAGQSLETRLNAIHGAVHRLMAVLDRDEVVLALDRMKRRRRGRGSRPLHGGKSMTVL